MGDKTKTCIVSCSALKDEIEALRKKASINADAIYISKFFHVNYEKIDTNLRKVLEKTLPFYDKIILVYGDLCLGTNNEMQKLAKQYGITKVDAVNCLDCILGGKGSLLKVDPDQQLLFLNPSWIAFFKHFKEQMQRQGVPQAQFAAYFKHLRGICFIDSLNNAQNFYQKIEELGLGIPVVEIKQGSSKPRTAT